MERRLGAAMRKVSAFRVFWLASILVFAGCRNRDLEKGAVCLSLGDYPAAIRYFGAAVETDPEEYAARLGLGKALIQKAVAEGDTAAFAYALVQFDACRSLHPTGDFSGLLADAYTERARSLLDRKDTLAALAAVAKAIERSPNSPQPLNLAGIIYGKLGDVQKSETLFLRVLRLDSADASAHFNLGMLLWQAGEYRKAHEHWFRTLQALPQDEDVLYWFALSEKKMREAP